MKTIKLFCSTLGKKPGEFLQVGDEEGQISLEDAKTLVAERMAEEYTAPIVGGNSDRVKELEDEIEDLNEYVAELKSKISDLSNRNTELEGQLALLSQTPPATGNGKGK